jgi:hypothetical protein
MVVRRQFWFIATALAAACLATTARADAAADVGVAAMDAAVNPPAKQMFDYQVDNQEPDKPLRVLAVKLQTNGASNCTSSPRRPI